MQAPPLSSVVFRRYRATCELHRLRFCGGRAEHFANHCHLVATHDLYGFLAWKALEERRIISPTGDQGLLHGNLLTLRSKPGTHVATAAWLGCCARHEQKCKVRPSEKYKIGSVSEV